MSRPLLFYVLLALTKTFMYFLCNPSMAYTVAVLEFLNQKYHVFFQAKFIEMPLRLTLIMTMYTTTSQMLQAYFNVF